ncbi:MAG: tripartite tricarboxylate transporter permease [Bryobacterales bacterium]|nr:tripartite tricarboxylate transporter permease [Bryobacterales bacterium]
MGDWIAGITAATQPEALLFLLAGVALGAVFGALPGLTATMGVAVLTPVTFWAEGRVRAGDAAGDLCWRDSRGRRSRAPPECARHACVDRRHLGRLRAHAPGQGGFGSWRSCAVRARRPTGQPGVSCCAGVSHCFLQPALRPRRVLRPGAVRDQSHGGCFRQACRQRAAGGHGRTCAGDCRPRPDHRGPALHFRAK